MSKTDDPLSGPELTPEEIMGMMLRKHHDIDEPDFRLTEPDKEEKKYLAEIEIDTRDMKPNVQYHGSILIDMDIGETKQILHEGEVENCTDEFCQAQNEEE